MLIIEIQTLPFNDVSMRLLEHHIVLTHGEGMGQGIV